MSDTSRFGRWISHPPMGEEVVISGISGRFPESNNVNELQENLFSRRDMVTGDDRRWKLQHSEIPHRSGKIFNIDRIDAGYFGLHYRQADIMDPAIRKFLECSVEAILDAGLNPTELEGSRTAVCVGIATADMETYTLAHVTKPKSMAMTGYQKSFMAHRVSYFLKLKGISCVCDSSCSSSLSALEVAFKLIRLGKCDNAIVGGSNLLLHPGSTRQFFRLGATSLDGVCKVFDESANGYVRSEAIGCVFLQRAKNARRSYGQVLHIGSNQDGFKPEGITFPSSQSQKELINAILKESEINPNKVSFMEAHGTGTQVGDPSETHAIDMAIAVKRTKPLLVGSVKSNVGHSEGSSGLNSLAKVIIALETGFIPVNIHLKKIKKGLQGFQKGRMKVVTEKTQLDQNDAIMALNNFGFGGSNVHLLVQRHQKVKNNQRLCGDDIPRLVCVSGRTKEAVLMMLEQVKNNPDHENIRLLHQIFQQDVVGHLYRGFTIVSKTGSTRTDVKFVSKQLPLHVIFGNFEQGYKCLYENLTKFPCFKKTARKINHLIQKIAFGTDFKANGVFGSFLVQMGLADILKLIKLEPISVDGYSVGKIVSDYFNDEITLEESVNAVYKLVEALDSKSKKLEKIWCCPVETRKKCRKSNLNVTDFELLAYKNQGKQVEKHVILNISDQTANSKKNNWNLTGNGKFLFLEVLGRLYQEGYNFQLHKLYPLVEFPISRGVSMISPLIQWDYKKKWYTFKYEDNFDTEYTQHEYSLSERVIEDKYLLGHVIDGRNLIPGAKYLELVQKTLAKHYGKKVIGDGSTVFENCKFFRAVTLPKTDPVHLLVSIQKSSGCFEILEKDSVVVSGKVFWTENTEKYMTDLPKREISEDRAEFLDQDEIYTELSLRGYYYSDAFKGLVKCNVDASAALIKWENNWTTFIDNMLQVKILQMDTRSLYIPLAIRKVIINPLKHLSFIEKQKDSLCPVYSCKESDITKCGGIEICGLQGIPISKKGEIRRPVLEKNLFVPNAAKLNLEESVRVITQIILENSLESNFKAVEICDNHNEELLSPLFCKALDDLSKIIVNVTVSSKTKLEVKPPIKVEDFVLTSSSNLLLLTANKIFQHPSLLKQALKALNPNGFLLTRENTDFVVENVEHLQILTEHINEKEKLVLFQKTKEKSKLVSIKVTWKNFDWLEQLQRILTEDSEIVLHGQNLDPEGILGLVNCLRKEPNGHNIRCFFIMDDAPKFNVENSFYKAQFKKQMAINVFKKGKWGTYRHLLLEEVGEVEGSHFFVQNRIKGDLSSLQWVEGPLTPERRTSDGATLVFPYYCALNFKDIMIASGRVSIDNFAMNRVEQECNQGFEFSGIDINGRRVIGWSNGGALSTILLAQNDNLLPVPEDWTLEDAATVFIVYSTVIYGFAKIANLKPGMSILIHSGTGGIGLAAINLCLHHKLNIYVTVGNQEKRQYLKKHFPQILESHIGNSRDTSFEKMIKTQTKGKGVDIVLNSLSEEKLKASINCIAKGGHFIEIGAYDIGKNEALNLLLMERNINYHGVMLDRVFNSSAKTKSWVLNKIKEGWSLGYVKPLPRTVFEQDEIINAYKYMSAGKHIGKVVVKIRDENDKSVSCAKYVFKGQPRFSCHPEKTYIILGGLGGFGLELADWLYLRGAKNIVLVSRRQIQSGYHKQRIKNWAQSGVTIQVSTKDITTKQGCLELINEAKKLGPIDGVFNLAVVLKDGLLSDQTQETFKICLAPKAQATIHLDQITREQCPELRYFVVFSSVSCGRGNPGQTNYALANSIMERIIEKRKTEGLPGLAIQWGAIGEVGVVARLQKGNKELATAGTLQQKVSSCLNVLDKFLTQDHPIVASMVVFQKTASDNLTSAVDVIAYLLGIKDVKAAGFDTSLDQLGLDSIMATEVTQILEKNFDIFVTSKEARKLTFSKLQVLESRQSSLTTSNNIDNCSKSVSQMVMDQSLTIKIPSKVKDGDGAKSVLLLPGIDGAFDGMKDLTQNLHCHITGMHYSNYTSTNSVEKYAQLILPHAKKTFFKQGTFFIISYSFGTSIAIELVSLLEEKNFTGQLVLLDGSPPYLSAALDHFFSSDVETEFQLPTEFFTETLEKQTFDVVSNRIKAVAGYKFNHAKIKSQVHLFRAKEPLVFNCGNDYQLSQICEQPVHVTVVDGNHSTMLQQRQLAEDINKLLKV